VSLDGGGGVRDVQLLGVRRDGQVVARYDGYDGEERAGGLPAFGTTAGVVVEDVGGEGDLDAVAGAEAVQRAAGEGGGAGGDAVVEEGVEGGGHSGVCCEFGGVVSGR